MKVFSAVALLALYGCKGSSAATPTVQRGVEKKGFAASPLLSRTVGVKSKPGGANTLINGRFRGDDRTWECKTPSASQPAWAAFDVGVGPARLLFSWFASGNSSYVETMYGGPGSYRIETSADSTNGENGIWTSVVVVPDNLVMNRAHSFVFEKQRWVRWVVTGPSPRTYEYGVQISEIEIHDISKGAKDVWFFMGDSITAAAFDRDTPHLPGFAEEIHRRFPAYDPTVLYGGMGFYKSSDGLEQLTQWMALNPDAHYWAIGLGSNDPGELPEHLAEYRKNLTQLVTRLKKAGKVPVIARVPFSTGRDTSGLAKVVDEVTAAHGLPKGPDLFAWFKAHPNQLADGLHPNDVGIVEMNRLWAEAMAMLYTP